MQHFLFISLLSCLLPCALSLKDIRCYQCRGCSQRPSKPEVCPRGVEGCVTIREKRDVLTRDCFTQEWQERGCDVRAMANKTCTYCDDRHGCNGNAPDPIVCRSCDWNKMGYCDSSRVCRAPFRTESAQCYIIYRLPFGFQFGCLDEMSVGIEYMMSQDRHKLTYFLCDSNDCNRHANLFWSDWGSLLSRFRVCEVCRSEGKFCGPKVCDSDSIYSHFCLRSWDTFQERGCLSDFQYVHIKGIMDLGVEVICNSDNCNDKEAKPLYKCVDQHIYRARDGCAWFLTPTGHEYGLGRTTMDSCTDAKRCKICHYENCNGYLRKACYNTTGKSQDSLYIREGQTDFMDTCYHENEICFTKLSPDGTVQRGCTSKHTPPEPGLELCSTNLCNRKIGGIYCFTCQPTDPNCVFSQHDGPFEMCAFGNIGCFTRVHRDNTVTRGCAKSAKDPLESTTSDYFFCDHSNLCNGKTTKFHSCNFLQLNLNFGPRIPVPMEYWQKPQKQGWIFEACEDSEGLPACYMESDYRDLTYGCTNELAIYDLVSYQRGSLLKKMNFCDGHYCNSLPDIKDPKRRL